MFKDKYNKQVLFGITNNNKIYPEFFDANNIFSHPFIQNLKSKPNMVQEL